uniref:Uncharacterized protein n=1 Tax=viral metagenome TaxID=1070528 RepID=A0A6M3M8D5_9ZZZZ
MNTPTPTVLEMGRLDYTGNIVPHTWYQHLTKPVKKRGEAAYDDYPYLEAIILLSDICYWYRPSYKRDEATGQVVAVEKKFAADKLQRSYQHFADAFGMGKDQVRNALKWLAERGIITIEFRDISVRGTALSNVMFVEPIPDAITAMQYPPGQEIPSSPLAIGHPPSDQQIPPVRTGETYTKSSSKNSVKINPSAFALALSRAPQATPDEDGIYTASMVDESDERVTCPACGEPVIVARQPNTQGTCPHCEVGLRIMDPHGATRKKGKKKLLTLEIFADCPPALSHIVIPGGHADDLKRAHAADPTYVWEAIRWAAGKVAEGNMQANVMVRAAVGWALKRLDAAAAASGEAPSDLETVPLPELRARLAGGELRMDDLDAGEQAVVLARLGALP